MSSDPQTGTSTNRANTLQIPNVGIEETGELSPSILTAINHLSIDNSSDESSDELEEDSDTLRTEQSSYANSAFDESTTTLSQPVGPAEHLRALIINRPTAQMITTFRLQKTREEMTHEEVVKFVLNPVPQGQKVLCKITRSKDGFGKLYPQYELYIEDTLENGDEIKIFLLAAKKRKKSKSSHYVITTDRLGANFPSDNIVGKVRSNFLGTAFGIYSNGRNPFKREPESSTFPIREEFGAVVYDPNILGFKGPRKMTVLLIGMTKQGARPVFRPETDADTLIGKFKNGEHRDILVLHNKSPQWNEETQSYVLNFSGRVTLASVKNFQIVHDNDLDYIIMQFGRVEEDTFTMDFMYPMCPLQAFAIALTSFDAKLAYGLFGFNPKFFLFQQYDIAQSKPFKGEFVVITGGTRGIGYSIAQKFAQNGARCALIGRNKERVEKAKNYINKNFEVDNNHLGYECDLRIPTEIENVCTVSLRVSYDSLVVRLKEQNVNDIIQTNLLGTIYMCSHISKQMIKTKKGCIINISSVVGLQGNSGQSVYSASKAGIIGFSKSLAKELARKNIRVNVIAPGFIETDMTSTISEKETYKNKILMQRFGKPEEVSDAALYLAKADYVTGQTLIVDGGLIST
ncbi:8795_t:CDS:10 [Funneliformis geosporum]|uniref:8795_t:CDS:1 n=1 Tax=Funneliformis geosporum TaxID=1117311 RepID=A0A9W4WSX1_9GLOM|nr:8795_t:CDS:10 [Funneliformis geosporum]